MGVGKGCKEAFFQCQLLEHTMFAGCGYVCYRASVND